MKIHGAEERARKIINYIGSQDSSVRSISISYDELNNEVWKSQIEYKIIYENNYLQKEAFPFNKKMKKVKVLKNELSALKKILSEKMKYSGSFNLNVFKGSENEFVKISFCPEKVEPDYEKLRKTFRVDYGNADTDGWRKKYVPHTSPEMKVVRTNKNDHEITDGKEQFI